MRPASLLAAGVLVAAGCVPAATPSQTASALSSDVTTYRGDGGRSGVMPGPGPSGTPAIAWQFQAGAPIESSAVVFGAVAFIASKDGVMHALDLATGAERWLAPLGAAVGAASPLLVDGLLVLGDLDGRLHALDPGSGRPSWSTTLDGPIDGSAAAVGDEIFAATERGSAYALDARSGAIKWQVDVSAAVTRSVSVSNGLLVVGAGTSLVGLSTADGAIRWTTKVADAGACGTPTIVAGSVFAATGIDDGGPDDHSVVAIDAATGAIKWRLASGGRQPYSPAVIGGKAFVVSEDKTVMSVDVATGSTSWTTTIDAPIEALPTIVGDVIYIATDGHEVVALETSTGHVLWRVPISGGPFAPTVSHGLVIVATSTGTVFAIGAYGA